MSDLYELYQQVILDHNKSPRNFRVMTDANHSAEGFNPLCGDHLNVYLKMDGEVITDVSFDGSGCAISKASASMMTAALKGKTQAEAEKIFTAFHDMVSTDNAPDAALLGKLTVFSGVREFPARVKCASLAWHTLHAAFSSKHAVVSTEE